MNNIKNNETVEQIEETEETGELEVNRVKSLKTNVKGGTWGWGSRCCFDGGDDGTGDGSNNLLSRQHSSRSSSERLPSRSFSFLGSLSMQAPAGHVLG